MPLPIGRKYCIDECPSWHGLSNVDLTIPRLMMQGTKLEARLKKVSKKVRSLFKRPDSSASGERTQEAPHQAKPCTRTDHSNSSQSRRLPSSGQQKEDVASPQAGEGHSTLIHDAESNDATTEADQLETHTPVASPPTKVPIIQISGLDQQTADQAIGYANVDDVPTCSSTEPDEVEVEEAKHSDKLWVRAYTNLANDKKSKHLVDSYKVLLNGDTKQGDEGYKDPAQEGVMRALVEEKLQIMTKKQWTLRWGKTSLVVREKAEKILNIVQQFSGIGTAVANLDPTHAAGIAWAGVCVLLPVSYTILLVLFIYLFPSLQHF